MSKQIIFWSTLLLLLTKTMSIHELGPADISIESMDECKNADTYPHPMNLKMVKVNRTHAGYSGCFELNADMDETSALNLTAEKWGDGGWKPNAFNYYSPDLCKTADSQVKAAWDAVLDAIGRTDHSCPLPKGKYCCEKLTMNLNGLFPSMLYGKFRVEFRLEWNNEPYMCLRSTVISSPAKQI